MFQDFKELLSAFNAHNVKYLVIGGYAVSFHAQPRLTKDLDLFILADPTNARAAYDALREFGAPLAQINVDDLADPQKSLRLSQQLYANFEPDHGLIFSQNFQGKCGGGHTRISACGGGDGSVAWLTLPVSFRWSVRLRLPKPRRRGKQSQRRSKP